MDYTIDSTGKLLQYNGTDARIVIPDGVTLINWGAFRNCTTLTSVTIPSTVTSIGKGAFQNCTNLTLIVIPESVTSIGESAFTNCTGLTSIVIPESVTYMGSNAFSNWYNTQTIYVESTEDFISGWRGYCDAKVYLGLGVTWQYDANGNPVPIE